MIDLVLVWLTAFGVWPFANPEHDFYAIAGTINLIVHWVAAFALIRRWKVVRRDPR